MNTQIKQKFTFDSWVYLIAVFRNPCAGGEPSTDLNGSPFTCSGYTDGECVPGYYCHIGAGPDDTVCCPSSKFSNKSFQIIQTISVYVMSPLRLVYHFTAIFCRVIKKNRDCILCFPYKLYLRVKSVSYFPNFTIVVAHLYCCRTILLKCFHGNYLLILSHQTI